MKKLIICKKSLFLQTELIKVNRQQTTVNRFWFDVRDYIKFFQFMYNYAL